MNGANAGGMVLISNNQSPSNLQGGVPQDVSGNTFPSGNDPQRQMMNGYGANGANIGNINGGAPPNGMNAAAANPMDGMNGMNNGMRNGMANPMGTGTGGDANMAAHQ